MKTKEKIKNRIKEINAHTEQIKRDLSKDIDNIDYESHIALILNKARIDELRYILTTEQICIDYLNKESKRDE